MKVFPTLLVLLFTTASFSQNLFDEKFKGCNTDHFAMESDSAVLNTNKKDLISTILKSLKEKDQKKLSGKLTIQVIVDLNGNSCLISVENKTNINSKKLNLKSNIDALLKWAKPEEKSCAIVELTFYKDRIVINRFGINGKKGFHQLKI